MSLTAQINVSAVVHESDDSTAVRSVRVTNISSPVRLTDGTGANKAQVCWTQSGTLSTATTIFVLPSLPDSRGTVSMSSVKSVVVRNDSTSTIRVGSANFSEPLDGQACVKSGGAMMLLATASGYTVSTGMISSGINLASVSGTASYTITIIGEGTLTTP
jgi:hypothetical protein